MKLSKKVAKGIENLSEKITLHTVGKSFPVGMHEPDLSEDVKRWVKEKNQK